MMERASHNRTPDEPVLRVSFAGCLCSELVKLGGLISTWVFMGVIVAGLPLVAMLVAAAALLGRWLLGVGASAASSFAVMFWMYLGATLGDFVVVVGVFGVLSITAEYTMRSIQSTLIAVPRRGMLIGAKVAALAVYVMTASFVGIFLGVVVALLMSGGFGFLAVPSEAAVVPFVAVLGGPIALAMVSLIAWGLGAICRSTLGGVLSFIFLFSILPTIVGIGAMVVGANSTMVVADAWLPSRAFITFLTGVSADLPISSAVVNRWQGGLILMMWTACVLVAAGVAMSRSNVT
ncbi:hypothetical protein [uncultured Bifidobacterium sp.]|uniref:hypothetical protein n=1 Tax=uncultured Bifidobacterium sp. TaxID=165187 RepID=UPI0026063792|nr:hypothetical protein [uncultured Bifidobacterium sp.]